MTIAERYHDFSAGHRVYGHENKCKHLHGHNYRVHFSIAGSTEDKELDDIGRVMDFGVIKSKLCQWLEENWDHKMLMYDKDPMSITLQAVVPDDIVKVPFNPTAENMAKYLVEVVAPKQLFKTGCELIRCKIEETRKCSATYEC